MFQFMLVVGLVLAYYGYAVTKNPRIWGDQGRDAIKEENWNRYVRYNGQFAMPSLHSHFCDIAYIIPHSSGFVNPFNEVFQ